MHQFTDAKGNTWHLTIDVATIKRVRSALGLYLPSLADNGGEPLRDLLNDYPRFIDVLFVLCQEQVEKKLPGPDADLEFGRCFWGDALEDAANSFVAALLDFFPDRKVRETLKKVVNKSKQLSAKLLEQVEQQLDQLNLDELAKTLSGSSGSAPACSASTQVPSPSAN
ncbi:MAG: hypothetical protein KatS3mg082_2733 [Nitrospiraceae bacterium]|nr:MAG: hypothetical protein KatS3mg082_2733 [Nitrospiraceae bacterium]GIW81336.1 MAG: hypothetical protein KatS3mg105_3143 [Gemmatales bacterium]